MRTVMITGAAGGIGSETAQLFAGQGCRLVLADVQPAALDALAQRLQAQYGADCVVCPGDLADETYWQQLVAQAAQPSGNIDVLVNNAAWRTIETLRTMELATWEQTLRICLTAPTFLSRLAAASMQPGSVIVNVSSMMADRPAGTSPAYIAAKGAMDALTRELAITYGRQGIRVVGVSPGYIDTDLSRDYHQASALISSIVDLIPLARGGSPREVAEAICWLSSPQAAYITGTTLVVDGGFKPNFSPYSIKKSQFPEEY